MSGIGMTYGTANTNNGEVEKSTEKREKYRLLKSRDSSVHLHPFQCSTFQDHWDIDLETVHVFRPHALELDKWGKSTRSPVDFVASCTCRSGTPKTGNQSMQLYNPQKPVGQLEGLFKALIWKSPGSGLLTGTVKAKEMGTVHVENALSTCVCLESHPSDAQHGRWLCVCNHWEARSLDRNYAKNQGVSWSLFVMPEIHLLSRLEEHSARHHAFSQDEQSTATTLPWLETWKMWLYVSATWFQVDRGNKLRKSSAWYISQLAPRPDTSSKLWGEKDRRSCGGKKLFFTGFSCISIKENKKKELGVGRIFWSPVSSTLHQFHAGLCSCQLISSEFGLGVGRCRSHRALPRWNKFGGEGYHTVWGSQINSGNESEMHLRSLWKNPNIIFTCLQKIVCRDLLHL